MFSKSFVIFALLAAFCAQGYEAKSFEQAESRLGLPDLIAQARGLIEELLAMAGAGLRDALDTMYSLLGAIYSLTTDFETRGLVDIDASASRALEVIQKVSAEAEEQGKDISACIEGKPELVEDIRDEIVESGSSCIRKASEKATDFANHRIDTFKQAGKDIAGLPVRLTKCAVTLKPIKCVNTLIADMKEIANTIPKEIASISKDSQEMLNSLKEQMQGCNNNSAKEAEERNQAIAAEINACVNVEVFARPIF